MAAPKPAYPPRAPAATPSQLPANPEPLKCDQSPGAKMNALMATHRISATLATVSPSAVRPPAVTEAQLINATVQIVASATSVNPLTPRWYPKGLASIRQCSSDPPTATFMKIARPTAKAACDPALATANVIQPYKKPTALP